MVLFLLVFKCLSLPWLFIFPNFGVSMFDSLIFCLYYLFLFFSLGSLLFSIFYIKKLKLWLLTFYTLINLLPFSLFLSCLVLAYIFSTWVVLALPYCLASFWLVSDRLGYFLLYRSSLRYLVSDRYYLVSLLYWVSSLVSLISSDRLSLIISVSQINIR